MGKTMDALESELRQFRTLNKEKHDSWEEFVLGMIGLDTDGGFIEASVVGYIGDCALKHGEEMSAMLARAYVSSYQANYDYYVDKLGLTPKRKPSASGHYEPERLYKALYSYASKLGRKVDGLFREHSSGKINGRDFRYKLINVLNQSETALNAFFQQELQYIANKSAIDSMNDSGVERYIFIAVMDGKTSETCSGLNGKIFSVNGADIGVNVPPLHPNCRSEIIPYDEEDFLQHRAEMGYEEWFSVYAEEYFGVDYIAGGQLKVTAKMMSDFGWSVSDAELAKLNGTLVRYGITDARSIRLFMATCGHESGKGALTLEGLNKDGSTVGKYKKTERGAGYIQITWRDTHLAFLKSLNNSFTGEDTATYIAENYPWEAAGWFWGEYWKVSGDEITINEYVMKHGEAKGVFMISQMYVNFGDVAPGLSQADAVSIRNDTVTWSVKSDSSYSTGYALYIGNKKMCPAPHNWPDREKNYSEAMKFLK